MSQFKQFYCKLKWRLFKNDLALDYDVQFDSNAKMYQVRQEYDLRLFCLLNACKSIKLDFNLIIINNCFKQIQLMMYRSNGMDYRN